MRAFEWHQKPIHTLEFIKEQEAIASGDSDGKLYLWGIENCKKKFSYSVQGSIFALKFIAEMRRLAVGLESGVIVILNLSHTFISSEASIKAHEGYISDLVEVKDMGLLVSGSGDGEIGIWDLKKQNINCIRSIKQGVSITSLIVVLKENLIITNHEDKFLRVWDWSIGKLLGEKHDITFGSALVSIEESGEVLTAINYLIGKFKIKERDLVKFPLDSIKKAK